MIQIVECQIDHEEIVNSVSGPETGAIVTFDGTVRNNARDKFVTHLYYQAYPQMAALELEKIRTEAMRRWDLNNMAIVHRIGRMEIGESSVFIAVASSHREDAFAACRFIIDTLKTTVPIWKKEYYQDGEVWIESYRS